MAGNETSLRSQLHQAQAELPQTKSLADQAIISIPPLETAVKKKEDESKRTKGDYNKSAVSSQKLTSPLSGGARERSTELLSFTNELKQRQGEWRQKESEMREIDRKIGSPEVGRQYSSRKESLQMKNYQLNVMKQHLANTDYQRLLSEMEEMKTTLRLTLKFPQRVSPVQLEITCRRPTTASTWQGSPVPGPQHPTGLRPRVLTAVQDDHLACARGLFR